MDTAHFKQQIQTWKDEVKAELLECIPTWYKYTAESLLQFLSGYTVEWECIDDGDDGGRIYRIPIQPRRIQTLSDTKLFFLLCTYNVHYQGYIRSRWTPQAFSARPLLRRQIKTNHDGSIFTTLYSRNVIFNRDCIYVDVPDDGLY
jgi:hypothetical protein